MEHILEAIMSNLKLWILTSTTLTLSITAATAADIPSKKKPIEDNVVRYCKEFGTDYIFLPGAQTCLRLGGRVRADYFFIPSKDVYSGISTSGVPTISGLKNLQESKGYEGRLVINMEAKTTTDLGAFSTYIKLREYYLGGNQAAAEAGSGTMKTKIERAYVNYVGITAGIAADNFETMGGKQYGDMHVAGFSGGALQAAYTAKLTDDVSGTIALQQRSFTTKGGNDLDSVTTNKWAENNSGIPQINGKIELKQSWGSAQLVAAIGQAQVLATTGKSLSASAFAIGAGAQIKMDSIASGDVLSLTSNYADGMTEYTSYWTGTHDERGTGGFMLKNRSYVTNGTEIQNVKSWNVAAALDHFWAPKYRSTLFGSFASLSAPALAKSGAWNNKYFGDATTYNVGLNLSWLPVKGADLGVEVMYDRLNQDVRDSSLKIWNMSDGNWSARVRAQKDF